MCPASRGQIGIGIGIGIGGYGWLLCNDMIAVLYFIVLFS